ERKVNSARIFELAFPRNALERLIGVLDAILVVGPVRGKQLHDLVDAVGHHVADRTRREVDVLTDLKPMFLQRGSPDFERNRFALVERCFPRSDPNIAVKISSCLENSVFSSGPISRTANDKIADELNGLRGIVELESLAEAATSWRAFWRKVTGETPRPNRRNLRGRSEPRPVRQEPGQATRQHNGAAFMTYRLSHARLWGDANALDHRDYPRLRPHGGWRLHRRYCFGRHRAAGHGQLGRSRQKFGQRHHACAGELEEDYRLIGAGVGLYVPWIRLQKTKSQPPCPRTRQARTSCLWKTTYA